MAGGKTNTIVYKFEGDTRDLEEDIKRLTSKFKSLKQAKTDSITGSYSYEGETLDLMQAYEKIVKAQRGVRSMLKKGQGILTKEDKEDLKQLRELRSEIEEGLANPDMFNDTKSVDAYQKKVKVALRIAHKIRKRALEEYSKTELKESKAVAKEKERLNQALTPEQQAAASLNIQNFGRLSKFADMKNPQEVAFIEGMQAKIAAYKSALEAFNAEQERYNSLVNISETDTQRLEQAQVSLAAATVSLNDQYKNSINTLRKMSQLQRQTGKKGRTLLGDFSKKLYSQSLRQVASQIISVVVTGVKEAFASIAQVFEPFNKAMSELTSSLKYAINSIASVVTPIIQMLTPALSYLSEVVARVSMVLAKLFSTMAGNDTFAVATKQVEDYANAVNELQGIKGIDELNKIDNKQNNFLVVEVEGMENLKSVSNVLDSILGLVTAITDPLANLLSNILVPLCNLIASIMTVLQPVIDAVSFLVGGLLNGLVTALTPILSWINTMISNLPLLIGLVTSLIALWILWKTVNGTLLTSLLNIAVHFALIKKRILEAVAAATSWIAKAVVQTAKNIKLAISTWVAEKAYWKLALAAIAAAGMLAAVVAGIVMTAVASASSVINNNESNGPDMVAMATGGVVSAPTVAMVGEGKYPEAVVPLGQSPQFESMKQGIAEEVVSLMGPRNSAKNDRPVVLNIDGRTLARALWPDLINTQYQVGVKLK